MDEPLEKFVRKKRHSACRRLDRKAGWWKLLKGAHAAHRDGNGVGPRHMQNGTDTHTHTQTAIKGRYVIICRYHVINMRLSSWDTWYKQDMRCWVSHSNWANLGHWHDWRQELVVLSRNAIPEMLDSSVGPGSDGALGSENSRCFHDNYFIECVKMGRMRATRPQILLASQWQNTMKRSSKEVKTINCQATGSNSFLLPQDK